MKIRFSVKLMLCAVALLCALMTFGARLYEWYYAVPIIPLADAIATFNAQYGDDPVGRHEPPVSEKEVLASIRAQLPNLAASKRVKTIYSDVVRTKRVPGGSRLYAMSSYQLRDGAIRTVWWINLNVPGYGLRIRENNTPVAKPMDEPKLESPNHVWISQTPQ